MAAKLGKTLGHVSQFLALTEIPEEVRDNFTRVKLDFSHIRELIRLKDSAQQIKLAEECAAKDLSVKALKSRVDQLLNPKANDSGKATKSAAETPAFKFAWKGEELYLKVRPFRPAEQKFDDYLLEIGTAYHGYVTAHPEPRADKSLENSLEGGSAVQQAA